MRGFNPDVKVGENGEAQFVEKQEALPGLELHEVVEAMSPAERAEYKQRLLDEINDREKLVWLINEVNEVEGVE